MIHNINEKINFLEFDEEVESDQMVSFRIVKNKTEDKNDENEINTSKLEKENQLIITERTISF